jgi:hypothetical protein
MGVFGNYYFDDNHPHYAVWNCFLLKYRECLIESDKAPKARIVTLEKFINLLFNADATDPRLVYKPQYGERYYITSYWWSDLLYPDHLAVSGGIANFVKGSKYLALVDSSEWSFYDESAVPDFPAVFYSSDEIKAWFAASIRLSVNLIPELEDELICLASRYIDIQHYLKILVGKIKSDIPWDHGPARITEPRAGLWYERAREEKMNKWILQWLD